MTAHESGAHRDQDPAWGAGTDGPRPADPAGRPAEDPFQASAGAYLLGALSPDEQAAYERHLASCPRCAQQVAELRPVVELLGAVREPDLVALGKPVFDAADPQDTGVDMRQSLSGVPSSGDGLSSIAGSARRDDVPDTLLPALVTAAARRERRHRSLVAVLGGLAAAAVIALTVVVVTSQGSSAPAAVAAAARVMTPLNGAPVRATATMITKPWGTEITLNCHYAAGTTAPEYPVPERPGSGPSSGGGGASVGIVYTLAVTDVAGKVHDLGSWTLAGAQDAKFTSGVGLPQSRIRTIDVLGPNGTPVLKLAG